MKILKFKGEVTKPSILIIAGTHGNETTPLLCLNYFLQDFSPEFLSDCYSGMTIVNGLNIQALHSGTREIKPDNISDLNRAFKSNEYEPVKIIKDLVAKHDIIIDIHSSPSIPEFVLIDIDENANSYVEWCKKAKVLYAARYSSADTIKKYSINKGKIGVTIELNGMDSPDFLSATKGQTILHNLIVAFEEIKFEKSEPSVLPMVEVRTHKEGLFVFKKELGECIKEGECFASLTGLDGEEIGKFKAPVKGYIIEGPDTSYYVKAGSKVALIQPYQK
jgi:predicted deacylase